MIANGYMNMRWYQHKVHGGKDMTSLRKRLPNVAMDATIHAKNRSIHVEFVLFVCDIVHPLIYFFSFVIKVYWYFVNRYLFNIIDTFNKPKPKSQLISYTIF